MQVPNAKLYISVPLATFKLASQYPRFLQKDFRYCLITPVNTQNVSVKKIVDSSSIQRAETKYGLRIQFLALVFMIHEVWLMRKIVTWEGIHVSALRSQTVSNDYYAL